MFRLTATLVATTLMRPWRTGWSVDRGVHFSWAPTAVPATTASTDVTDLAPSEPSCFVDEDWATPAEPRTVQTATGSDERDAGPEPVSEEATGLQVWWSLAGKPSQS